MTEPVPPISESDELKTKPNPDAETDKIPTILSRLVESTEQVRLEKEGDKFLLIFPPEQNPPTTEPPITNEEPKNKEENPPLFALPSDLLLQASQLWQSFTSRLQGMEKTWKTGTEVHLWAEDRLLDNRQLHTIDSALKEVGLHLTLIQTTRRQTAVVGATLGYSINQTPPPLLPPEDQENLPEKPIAIEPLYLTTTIRSGVELKHKGTIILVGDLNPGGSIIAGGDIIVFGNLRGLAHAGAEGNRDSKIMALRLEPTQIRIADLVARPPANPPNQYEPEIAYITPDGIRLSKINNWSKFMGNES